jgi:hypothetical protein
MPNIFSQLLRLPPGGMGRVVVGEKPNNENKTGIEVTAAIFFDGTGNNRNNTAQRRMAEHNKQHPEAPRYEEEGIPFNPAGYEQYGKNKAGKPIDSYEAGYSNVSILERMNLRRDPPQKDISLYIEGIGTQDNLGDDTKGSGFGKGKTGVKSKVQMGVGRMVEELGKVLETQEDTFVEKLTIDVFGFSRGATAARHFVSLLNDSTPLAARLGVPQAKVTIKFVGVFDTVSSVGYELLGFGSDVAQLGLDLKGVPQKVVHLTAANEYRKNFSLTDITSSVEAGVGYELVLPGVHSNIGGSYGEVTDEEERHLRDEEHRLLIEQGWYRPEEITRTPYPVYHPDTGQHLYTTYSTVGRRLGLTWEYQFIPLAIMAQAAAKLMTLEDFVEDFEKYTLPADHPLTPLRQAIEQEVGKHGEQGRHALQLPQDPALSFKKGPAPVPTPLPVSLDLVKLVRNRYLHRSASRGWQGLADKRLGMGERRQAGKPHRRVFPG